jgi:hypothetical protein
LSVRFWLLLSASISPDLLYPALWLPVAAHWGVLRLETIILSHSIAFYSAETPLILPKIGGNAREKRPSAQYGAKSRSISAPANW